MNNITKPHTFVIATAANPTEVNANFDTAYTGINNIIDAVNDASGSKNSIDERLDVALNEDGTIKAGTVISGNTTAPTPAFRVTQEGTGNAFVVEDSTNPDTSQFVVTNDGTVVIGGTGSYGSSLINSTAKVQIGAIYGVAVYKNSDDATPCSMEMVRSRATGNVVQNNDGLGRVIFGGNDGTGGKAAAYIDGVVDGTPGAGDMPGRIVMSTSPDGSTTPTERLRIDSAGLTKVTGTFETTSNATIGGNLTAVGTTTFGGSAAYQCRAWVRFDGTLAAASMIQASSPNVTSITDNGTGNYTVNFNALADANYCVVSHANANSSTQRGAAVLTRTTTSCQVRCEVLSSGSDVDCNFVDIAIFR